MKQARFTIPFSKTATATVALVVLVLSSCSPAPDPLLDMLDTQLSTIKIDSLSRTMQFVVSPERFQKKQFEEKLAAALNSWAKAEADLMDRDQWALDPMVSDLLTRYSNSPSVERVSDINFVNTDSYAIQQNFWAEKLGQRLIDSKELGPFELYRLAAGDEPLSEDEDSDPLTEIMGRLNDGLSADEAGQLATSVKLFDWVVRNIYLLPEDALTAGQDIEDLKLNDAEDLPAAGVPGLGYTRFPWQTMLYSRGDYVDRAKLFMTMIDQVDLDAVMLMTKQGAEEDETEVWRPWAVGVHIGDDLFLFDTKLGMPIPGEKPGSIATLAEARDKASVLDSLDLKIDESLKDETAYWVKAAQIQDVQGGILVSPESLSYRAWELENKLVGEARMKLIVKPTEVVERLGTIEGVTWTVWDTGFKTSVFRRALRDAIAAANFNNRLQEKIFWYFADELYINEFVRYRTARAKYFQGLFETIRNDGNLNSIELFYKMIYKDSKIESLAVDKIFQAQFALSDSNRTAAEFNQAVSGVQNNMRLVRRDSGFFLAHCHFDNGNFVTAANWLSRLEVIADTARWQAAINYLKGRSLEAQRDYDAAVEIYQKQESEQFHGDVIRARLIKQLAG